MSGSAGKSVRSASGKDPEGSQEHAPVASKHDHGSLPVVLRLPKVAMEPGGNPRAAPTKKDNLLWAIGLTSGIALAVFVNLPNGHEELPPAPAWHNADSRVATPQSSSQSGYSAFDMARHEPVPTHKGPLPANGQLTLPAEGVPKSASLESFFQSQSAPNAGGSDRDNAGPSPGARRAQADRPNSSNGAAPELNGRPPVVTEGRPHLEQSSHTNETNTRTSKKMVESPAVRVASRELPGGHLNSRPLSPGSATFTNQVIIDNKQNAGHERAQ